MVSRDDTRACLLNGWNNRVPICEREFGNCCSLELNQTVSVKPVGINHEPLRFVIKCCAIVTNKEMIHAPHLFVSFHLVSGGNNY